MERTRDSHHHHHHQFEHRTASPSKATPFRFGCSFPGENESWTGRCQTANFQNVWRVPRPGSILFLQTGGGSQLMSVTHSIVGKHSQKPQIFMISFVIFVFFSAKITNIYDKLCDSVWSFVFIYHKIPNLRKLMLLFNQRQCYEWFFLSASRTQRCRKRSLLGSFAQPPADPGASRAGSSQIEDGHEAHAVYP